MPSGTRVRRPAFALAGTLATLALAACNDVDAPSRKTAVGAPAYAHHNVVGNLPPDALRPVFGPQRIERDNGEPQTKTFSISGYGPNAILHVVNGDANGDNRTTSATIEVDGVEVAHQSDFNKKVGKFDVPLTIKNPSTIAVRQSGGPGTSITISVDAQLSLNAGVGSSGGAITLLGSEVALIVPPGALPGNTTITATPVAEVDPNVAPGTAIEMGPNGTQFSAPVTLRIAFDPANLPRGVKPSALKMFWKDGDEFVNADLTGQSVDLVNFVVSAQTKHFTEFALLPDAISFCPTDPTAYSDLQAAIDAAPSRGTVYVCDGTFETNGVKITKPLTLRGEHAGRATLVQAGSLPARTPVIDVSGAASRTVTIADIGIDYTQRGIYAHAHFDTLIVRNVSITAPIPTVGINGSSQTAITTDTTATPGAYVRIEGNTIVGGQNAVNNLEPVDIDIVDNSFNDGGAFGLLIHSANGATNSAPGVARRARVVGNRFTNPVLFGGVISFQHSGIDTVIGNRITMTKGSSSQAIFIGRAGQTAATAFPTYIKGNIIEGHLPTGDPADAATWGMFAALSVNAGFAGVADQFIGNTVSGVFAAIQSRSATGEVSATDNIVQHVYTPLAQASTASLSNIHRNDFSDYFTTAINFPVVAPYTATNVPAGALTCNYWGSPSGPTSVLSTLSPAAYIRFASAPIANTSTACDGTPSLLNRVRVCATAPATPDPLNPTVGALGTAYNSIATNGIISFCDGVYTIPNFQINKPLTLTADNPLGATLDAGTGAQVLRLSNVSGGSVIINNLKFTGGVNGNLLVSDNTGSAVISNNEFHAPSSVSGNLKWALVVSGAGIGTVNVNNNKFLGGDQAIQSGPAAGANFIIQQNIFSGQTQQSINFFDGTLLTPTIDANDFQDCASTQCIFSRSPIRVTNNTFRASTARRTNAVITLPLPTDGSIPASSIISDNTVIGTGLGTDRNVSTSYAFSFFVTVTGRALDLHRNRITDVFQPVLISTAGTVILGDNIMQTMFTPVSVNGPAGNPATVFMTKNDLADYVQAFQGVVNMSSTALTSLNLRCNYWGQATGPKNMPGGVPSANYTPFSTTAVAGQSTSCTP